MSRRKNPAKDPVLSEFRLTPEQIAERDARADAAAQRTLTARLCGDPSPGQSALAKRGA